MFSRRGILGLFSGLLSWFAAKKVVVAESTVTAVTPHPVEGYIQLPDWCPPGWVPLMGQNISKEQFPHLFEIKKLPNGHRYLPPFHGLEIGPLPFRPPTVPTELQAYGWVDRLTKLPRKEADTRILVHCMAANPQIASNKRIYEPGFCTAMVIERKQFEDFYGPIEKSSVGLFYNGYQVLDHHNHHA